MLHIVSGTLFLSAVAIFMLRTIFIGPSLLLSLPLAANAVNVIVSNDDGWAEKNIRSACHVKSQASC